MHTVIERACQQVRIRKRPKALRVSGHSLLQIRKPHQVIEVVHPALGWVYVGSHNFTQSAWGTLSGSGFNPVLNVTNYELGVVFPIKDEEQLKSVQLWERPPRRYGREDEPWVSRYMIAHWNYLADAFEQIQEECPLYQN